MEYYLALKKKKILPCETAWMNLEDIMLSEISQSRKDKFHLYVVSKIVRFIEEERGIVVARGWGRGK